MAAVEAASQKLCTEPRGGASLGSDHAKWKTNNWKWNEDFNEDLNEDLKKDLDEDLDEDLNEDRNDDLNEDLNEVENPPFSQIFIVGLSRDSGGQDKRK